ncbi:MAG: hypothetical protein VYC38_11610, partial [Pseudomonadota bacterium]|nr:hypothetical protein [Pseudomonadota bacterium]
MARIFGICLGEYACDKRSGIPCDPAAPEGVAQRVWFCGQRNSAIKPGKIAVFHGTLRQHMTVRDRLYCA